MTRFLYPFALLLALVVSGCGGPVADPAPNPLPPGPSPAPASAPEFASVYHAGAANAGPPVAACYLAGEWHVFQASTTDGGWAHLVSPDLVNWETLAEVPVRGTNGTVVIDARNTTGLGTPARPALVALSRADGERPQLTYSTDNGRSWTAGARTEGLNDPRLRDPQVFWDVATDRWTMVAAADDHVAFFASPDLIRWTYLSEWGRAAHRGHGRWTHPELLPLTVAETGERTFALLLGTTAGGPNGGGSGTLYHPGYWDGTEFRPRREATFNPADTVKWLDHGRDFYAATTFAGAPDGRAVVVGWLGNLAYAAAAPNAPGSLSVPRALTLHDEYGFGLRLRQEPVAELARLRGRRRDLGTDYVNDGILRLDLSDLPRAGSFEFTIDVDMFTSSRELYFTFSNAAGDRFYRFGTSRGGNPDHLYFADRRAAGRTDFHPAFAPEGLTVGEQWSNDQVVTFRAFFDGTSAEVFVHGGNPVFTHRTYAAQPWTTLTIESSGGEQTLDASPGWSVERAAVYSLAPPARK